MKEKFFKILTWLAVMAVLTLIAVGIWMLCFGTQTTASLKWLQFLQMLGTFFLPPFLCAWLWDYNRQPLQWLRLNRGADWQVFVLAVILMICAIPAINLLADLNSRISFPESLSSLEQFLKQQEETAAALTERFLQADNIGSLLLNIGLMALLPALAEELSFRGTLQQIFSNSDSGLTSNSRRRSAVAIWVTAIIFSAVHMQFYGFIPRMLLGAMFGYIFLWTGSLWVPILMHFTNNGIAVIVYYLTTNEQGLTTNNKNIADTIGAGDTWWLGVISIVITSLGLLIFYRRTHTR